MVGKLISQLNEAGIFTQILFPLAIIWCIYYIKNWKNYG